MIINKGALDSIFTGFSTLFNAGFAQTPTVWPAIATKVPSSARENHYGWLGQSAPMREWLGPRVVNNMVTHGYTIENRTFEQTVSIRRDDLEDDRIGMFTPFSTNWDGRQPRSLTNWCWDCSRMASPTSATMGSRSLMPIIRSSARTDWKVR